MAWQEKIKRKIKYFSIYFFAGFCKSGDISIGRTRGKIKRKINFLSSAAKSGEGHNAPIKYNPK